MKSYKFDYSRYFTTLKETSYDKRNRIYMCESDLKVVDFDKLKDEYIKGLKLSDAPSSCDSLYLELKDRIVFIEFKNGKVEKYNIRKKIYDSILIFSDIEGYGISETRKKVDFILVYNYENNKNNRDYIGDSKKNIQESESFKIFGDKVSGYAKEPIIRFGINDFKNYLVKNIYTYTKEEFEKYFIKKL